MSTPGIAASGLRRTLQRRHMHMIALGGVIGAGLFVGSGVVIGAAGPAAVISFALTGALVVLVMRMLGEMAVVYTAIVGFYRLEEHTSELQSRVDLVWRLLIVR